MGASVKPAARRNARRFALQAIYSWQITKENVATIEEQFLSGGKYDEEEHHAQEPALSAPDTDVAYFRDLLTGVGWVRHGPVSVTYTTRRRESCVTPPFLYFLVS